MTGANTVLEGLSGLQDQKSAKRINAEPAPQVVAVRYLSLYPNRVQGILRPPGCKTWTTVSKHWPIEDETILKAIAGEEKNLWGLRWGEQTKFAVLDIDKGSKYHQAAELQKLQKKLAAVGLRATPYRSSESGGWHLYLFLKDWTDSNDLKETLKKWLYGQSYEIRNGTLEVFPSGMGLRLPLQCGFGWLDDNAELIAQREELTRDEAISRFLLDLETQSSNWTEAESRITAQLDAKQISQGVSVLEHEKAIDTDGFELLFNYRLIHEKYQDGRQYWQTGLTAKGQRHDAILAIEHYFWHGDQSAGVPALPGEWNDEPRYRLILAWLKENHNGFCNHINRGNWRKVEAQIRRACLWRRPTGAIQVREPYQLTERLIERLIARSKATGRTWTPEDMKKGNDGREEGARKRIREAVQLLIGQGRRVTLRQLMRLTGCCNKTIKRHLDIWSISRAVALPSVGGDQNPFLVLDLVLDLKGAEGTGTVLGAIGTSSEEEFLDLPGTGDSGDLDIIEDSCSVELAPIVLTPPFLLPGSQPTSALPVSISLRSLNGLPPSCAEPPPGPLHLPLSPIDTGALVRRYSGRTADVAGGSEPGSQAPVLSALGNLFVIPQTYRLDEKQTVVDVRRRQWLIHRFEFFLHQQSTRSESLTSSCLQCCVMVYRFSPILQMPRFWAWNTCRQLSGKHFRILIYGDVRGPPKCIQGMASQSKQ